MTLTRDLEVRSPSLAHRITLFNQGYKWNRRHTAWGGGGVTLRGTNLPSGGGGVAILLCMLHAKETGIGCDRLGLCLVCAFSLPSVKKEDGGIILLKFWNEISLTSENLFQWRIQGRGLWGRPARPSLYLDQTET